MYNKHIIKLIIVISLIVGMVTIFITIYNQENKLSISSIEQAKKINNVIYKTCQILSGINNHQSAIDSLEQLYKECNTLEEYAKDHYYSPESQLSQLDKLKNYRKICSESETLLLKEIARLEANKYYDCGNLRNVVYSYYARPSKRTGQFLPLFLPYSNLMIIADYTDNYSLALYLANRTEHPDYNVVSSNASLLDKLKSFYYQINNAEIAEALHSYTFFYFEPNSDNFQNSHIIYNCFVDVAMNDPLNNLVDYTPCRSLKGMVFPHSKEFLVALVPATTIQYTEEAQNSMGADVFEENLLHSLPSLTEEYCVTRNLPHEKDKRKKRRIFKYSYLFKLQPPCKSSYLELYPSSDRRQILYYNYLDKDRNTIRRSK